MAAEPAIPIVTWHAGEQRAQRLAGTLEKMAGVAERLGRDTPEPHGRFLAAREVVFVAAMDQGGRLWVSPLTGAPGFALHIAARRMKLEAQPTPGDPLAHSWPQVQTLGLVAIDPSTKTRIRINGTRTVYSDASTTWAVQQSYGNCPAFITPRFLHGNRGHAAPAEPLSQIPPEARAVIERADTFYIGSGHATHGIDASHRGGPPGFVRILDASMLEWPDYKGNGFFQTIGNLESDPRCALLFLNSETGAMLQLSGRAETDWDSPPEDPDAERMQRFAVERVVWWPQGGPVRSTPTP